MIKKLRFKFIITSMGGILLVLLIIFGTQNYLMYKSSREQTQRFLENIVHSDGKFKPFGQAGDKQPESDDPTAPLKPKAEMARATKFFFIRLDESKDIIDCDLSNISSVTKEDAATMALEVLDKDSSQGDKNGYQYLVSEKAYGYIIAFAERGTEFSMLSQLTTISVIAVIGGIIVFFILVMIFSKWAVKPIQTAFDNQRSFISNASHELKTPITVISANADVLKNEIGENKWLSNIQSQNERMQVLVKNLLTLAKTDEQKDTIIFCNFDLSAAILQSVLEFESLAFENHLNLNTSIEPNIQYSGSEIMVKQLIAILMDNAVKHTNKKGDINVSLKRTGNKMLIQVFNTGQGISEKEKDKIFDRFYRSDQSRSRDTGGYGLGLSIAKSIVDIHHGNVSVHIEKFRWIQFSIIL